MMQLICDVAPKTFFASQLATSQLPTAYYLIRTELKGVLDFPLQGEFSLQSKRRTNKANISGWYWHKGLSVVVGGGERMVGKGFS